MRDQAESAHAGRDGGDKLCSPRDEAAPQADAAVVLSLALDMRRRDLLVEQLRASKLRPPQFSAVNRNTELPAAENSCAVDAGGGSLRVAAGALWQDAVNGNATKFMALLERARRRHEAGVPASFWFGEFGNCDATLVLQQICERLRQSLLPGGAPAAVAATVIHSHAVPQRGYDLIATAALGAARRYVFLDELQLHDQASAAVAARSRANWKFFKASAAAARPLLPVYGSVVHSACPLLGDEMTSAVLASSGLFCPADTAWLPVEVPLAPFLCADGALDWRRLAPALDLAVEAGDELIDQVAWIEPALARDAALNRRLAIRITELGEVVARRRENPADLVCLQRLDRDVQRIRASLREATRRLARLKGPLPALQQSEPVDDWPNGPQREGWQRRWRMALARTAVRNRNLLVLSPYDVLPGSAPADTGYTDLLPVIRHADAWCFAGQPKFTNWSEQDFRRFHRRARATIQGESTQSLIAAGV